MCDASVDHYCYVDSCGDKDLVELHVRCFCGPLLFSAHANLSAGGLKVLMAQSTAVFGTP
jgi:hypothetical protein